MLTFVGVATLTALGGLLAEQTVAWSILAGLGFAALVTPLLFGLSFNKRTAKRWLWTGAALTLLMKLLLLLWLLIYLAQLGTLAGFRAACYTALAVLGLHGGFGFLFAVRGWRRYWRVRRRVEQAQ